MKSNNKLCIDCKFSSGGDKEYLTCHHPNNILIDKVTGDNDYRFKYCSSHRNDNSILIGLFIGTCGNRGRWFEPKF